MLEGVAGAIMTDKAYTNTIIDPRIDKRVLMLHARGAHQERWLSGVDKWFGGINRGTAWRASRDGLLQRLRDFGYDVVILTMKNGKKIVQIGKGKT